VEKEARAAGPLEEALEEEEGEEDEEDICTCLVLVSLCVYMWGL
jgi:hypothetical protein